MKLFAVVAVCVSMFAGKCLAAVPDDGQKSNAVPVCVYVGNGVKGIGPGRWLQLLSSTDGQTAAIPVDADDVLRKGGLEKFPLLVLPDGDAGEMASSMGERGRARIRAFIENGGACIASAAGARLLVQGGVGWGFVPWKVGAEPPRNPTQLSTTFTDAAANYRGMPKGGRRVWYNCGPVLEPGLGVPAASFSVVAKFKGDINPLDPQAAPPMTGAPSLLLGTLGKGRVALVADNPECNAQTFDIVRAILHYTLGAEVKFNVAQRKRGQPSVGFACGDGWGLERARHYLKMLSNGKDDVELLDGGRLAEGLWMHLDQVVRDGLTGPARIYDRSMLSRLSERTTKGPKVHAAIYADRGVSCAEFWNVAKLISFSPFYEVTFVDHHDIANGVVNARDFDLLLMSGGPIGVQESIVGAAGRAAVTNFVRQGGSYYGICAGTFSALQSVSPKHPRFALVPYKNMPNQPYRGWCNMNIRFTKDGAAALGVEPDSLRQVLYWGGPVMVPAEVPADSDIRPFAHYHGNVVNTFAGGSINPMAESVAVAGGRFGKGKVLCSAVHPESEEATRDIVKKYLKYLTGHPAEPEYTQHHRGALRVAFCMETATKAGMAFGMSLARDQRFDVRPVTPYEVNQGLLEHIDVLFFPWPEPRGYMSLVHDFIRKGGQVIELDPDRKGTVYKPGVHHVKDFEEARRVMLGQKSVPAAKAEPPVSAAPGRVTILHTNDSHTHVDDAAVPFSLIRAEVQRMRSKGENVILADAGDFVQGTAMGGYDGGKSVIEIMNATGYQVATLGNHEFDYGIKGLFDNLGRVKFPLVSCNFIHRPVKGGEGKLVLPRYTVVDANGVKVAFVGASTPTTLVSSKPSTFLDATGTYREWDFISGEKGEELYRAIQDSVNEAARQADYVVVIGHLGVSPDCAPYRSIDVIAHTTNYVAVIDGHSHSELTGRRVKNAAGKDVVLTQSGSYLGVLGSLVLDEGECVSAGTIYPFAQKDPAVAKMEDGLAAAVERQLGVRVAKAPRGIFSYDPVSHDRLARKQDCGAGDFAADAAWWYANHVHALNCDFSMMNGGNVRADIPAGDVTYKALRMVQPFGGDIGVVEATGQQVLDALEFGAQSCGEGECGGFLHVAGLKYVIDKEVPVTVKSDSSGTWVRGPIGGKYRVHGVTVYDRATGAWIPLELAKHYRIVGNAFTLVDGGDGFAMFRGSKVVNNAIAMDYLVLAEYAKNFKRGTDGVPVLSSDNSPLANLKDFSIHYENPDGSNRITFGR